MSEIRALTEETFELEAEPSLRQVFVNDNPYNSPFSQSVSARAVVYDGSSYHLESALLEAIVGAAKILGDTGCYLSSIWRPTAKSYYYGIHFIDQIPQEDLDRMEKFHNGLKQSLAETYPKALSEESPVHWYIPFCKIDTYTSPNGILSRTLTSENMLFSPTGQWGVIMTASHFGVLGGSQEFLQEAQKRLPDLERQVYGFLEEFRIAKQRDSKSIVSWIPHLIRHIYGEEIGNRMLQESGF